jgi:hypothetical protein
MPEIQRAGVPARPHLSEYHYDETQRQQAVSCFARGRCARYGYDLFRGLRVTGAKPSIERLRYTAYEGNSFEPAELRGYNVHFYSS